MELEKDFSVIRQELCSKKLLNLTESRIYLGLSRRLFEAIEHNDPTFPDRKTKTKYARKQLDEWLEDDGVCWWKASQKSVLKTRTTKFKVFLEQFN